MNKEGWKTQLKEMKRLFDIAKANVLAAQNQADEVEFNISSYKQKIETFK